MWKLKQENSDMKQLKQTIFALLVAFAAVACAPREENLIIISTSDTHAKIEMLPRLAAFVEEARSQDTARVFLVDAGDRWTGNPYVD